MESKGFGFASFVLDTSRHRLTGPGGEISLRPKSFEVLALLLAHAGRLVGKEEIVRAVWSDLVVTDDSLTRCVSDVRLALKDTDHTLIRTVAKLGYLIDIPVTALDEPAADVAAGPTPAPPAHAALRSEGGRRPASAVYVDVSEAMEALSHSDPEAALSQYEAVIAQASRVLRDLGATVQLVPGEGIAGLFGVPVAQEDHAERACQAALRCHASLGVRKDSRHRRGRGSVSLPAASCFACSQACPTRCGAPSVRRWTRRSVSGAPRRTAAR